MGGKIPWADWAQIFFGRRYPRHNHVFQIWWRSVQGFSVGWGSNFATSLWLWRSSFQHSHTTVWACDDIRRFWVYISGIWGAKSPGRIEPKFFLEENIPDVITCFKFGDDRFRGLALTGGQILPLSFDFDGRPYNTLTLPCERVMTPARRIEPLSDWNAILDWRTQRSSGWQCSRKTASHCKSMSHIQ